MAGTVVTILAKKKMLEARAGIKPLPVITGMAFGTGGVDESGQVVPHTESQNALNNEVLRKPVDGYAVISDTKIRYSCTLLEDEIPGEYISEVGLYDAEGDFVALKSFMKKGKDADMQVIMECDDTF